MGAQNFPDIVDLLMERPVFITEKVEGSNWWASIDDQGQIVVGQRNFAIQPLEGVEHDWWKVLRTQGFDAVLPKLYAELSSGNPVRRVTLRGEIVGPGIQGNYYKFKDHKVYLFDIECNGVAIDAAQFLELSERYELQTVPILAQGASLKTWLQGQSVVEASNGRSTLVDRKREGIVIKPMQEAHDSRLGRVFIKQRSPEYLAKSDF